jgi:hypothetical protein
VLGFVSPGYTLWDILIAPYSAVSQPMSGLGLGPTAPIMNGAFVLSGLLLLAGVTGVFDVHARVRGRVRAATVARGLSTKDGAAPRALVVPVIAEWHVGWSSRGGRSC